jgi:hypothetical protein
MTTFPSLIPSTRTYSPGEYPITPHPLLSGSEIRVRHSNTVLGVRLRLTFEAVSSADVVAVRNHYNGRQGGFLPFAIPVELLSGVTTPADFTPAGHQWVYASRPSVVDVPIAGVTPTNRHDLVVELVTVPPENTIVAGARITVRVDVRGGSAQLGAYIESFASVVGGAPSVVNPGAGAGLVTVEATVTGGAASTVTPDPNFANVKLLLSMNGSNGSTTFTDLSSSPATVTAYGGAAVSTAQSISGGSSLYLDGAGDYLGISSGMAPSTSDFCFEAYLRLPAIANQAIVSSRLVLAAATLYWFMYTDASGRLTMQVRNSGGTQFFASTATAATVNTDHHVAVSRTSGLLRVALDGTIGGTTANDGGLNLTEASLAIGLFNFTGFVTFGSFYMNWARYTVGQSRYTANFTPPSPPLPTL